MNTHFEELSYHQTSLGELILRRRKVEGLDGEEVYEVKLDGEFLMSSLVNESEIALANLALAEFENSQVDVLVGGLGLGYTANAALEHSGVRSVLVIERLAEVIQWHQQGLVPLGAKLTSDPRFRVIQGDFFALFDSPGEGLDPQNPEKRFHAILLDIDHSPKNLLHPRHGKFYEPDGLDRIPTYLNPRGVFALWSADPPDHFFLESLQKVFASSNPHAINFYNPLLNRNDSNTVYIARNPYDMRIKVR